MGLADTAKLVTALELQDKFSKPIAGAERSLASFEKRAKALDKLGLTLGRGLGAAANNLKLIGLAAGGLAIGGLAFSIKAASDLSESLNKVDVVFGGLADKVHAFGQTAAQALGQSRQQAEESAASFGNLFKVVGLTDTASADMSIRLVTLAGDLASFNNIDPAEALEKLRSGLIGEAEPLRSVGVLLTEASVQEEAYASGIATRGKKLTEGQKVQARFNLILKQTTTAQGDFARTSTGLANQQRILKATLTDTGAVIGTALLPTVNKLLLRFTTLLKEHAPDIQRFADSLPGVASRVEKVLGGLPWDSIGNAFKLMGSGAKAALEAFESAPPWLQTAILTGWGLNKLTGGALGSIVGQLGSGLIKGVLGMNAGVVNINAGVVNGGIPGVAGGAAKAAGAISIGSLLGVVSAVALGAIIGKEVGHAVFFDPTVKPAVEFETRQFNDLINSNNPEELRRGLDNIDAGLQDLGVGAFDPFGISSTLTNFLFGDQIKVLRDQRDKLQAIIDKLPGERRTGSRSGITPAFLDPARGKADLQDPFIQSRLGVLADTAIRRDVVNPLLLPFAEQTRILRELNRNKAQPVNVNVSVPVYVNASLIQSKIYQIKTSAKIREG